MNLHDRDIKVLAFKDGKKEGLAEGMKQGEKQGELKAKIETAKKMLKDKLSLETIIKYTGLSESIILKLSAE